MAQPRWSLSVPQDGFTLAEHVALAREAEAWGYTDAWSFESDGLETRAFAFVSVVAVAGMAIWAHDGLDENAVGFAVAYLGARRPSNLHQELGPVPLYGHGLIHAPPRTSKRTSQDMQPAVFPDEGSHPEPHCKLKPDACSPGSLREPP